MITYHDIRHNEEVRALIEAGNEALGVLGYTDHGYAHAGLTAKVAGDLLETLGYDERTCELARIAGFMHDIGNAVNRTDHALSGAALAFPILRSLGMDARETAAVITALGYLDELKKSTSGADNMRAQIKDYLEDAAKAKLAAEEARREVERLRREIGYLKEKK